MRVVMKNRFELVHVGINTESPEKALQLAELLSAMFHLQLRHGKKSEFAGDYFECMKAPFLGSKGHIAMQTDDLAAAVEYLFPRGSDASYGQMLTNQRQAEAAGRAREAVGRAREALEAGITPDALLTDVEEALSALGELTGQSVRDDVTDRIFQRFCVGK